MKPVKLKEGDVVIVSFEAIVGTNYTGNCICTGHVDTIDQDYLENIRDSAGTVGVVSRAGK